MRCRSFADSADRPVRGDPSSGRMHQHTALARDAESLAQAIAGPVYWLRQGGWPKRRRPLFERASTLPRRLNLVSATNLFSHRQIFNQGDIRAPSRADLFEPQPAQIKHCVGSNPATDTGSSSPIRATRKRQSASPVIQTSVGKCRVDCAVVLGSTAVALRRNMRDDVSDF
jgi:hypothetical protein